MLLAPVHTLPVGDAAVTSLGISERTRLVAVGYADGLLKIFHVTTDQLVAEAAYIAQHAFMPLKRRRSGNVKSASAPPTPPPHEANQ